MQAVSQLFHYSVRFVQQRAHLPTPWELISVQSRTTQLTYLNRTNQNYVQPSRSENTIAEQITACIKLLYPTFGSLVTLSDCITMQAFLQFVIKISVIIFCNGFFNSFQVKEIALMNTVFHFRCPHFFCKRINRCLICKRSQVLHCAKSQVIFELQNYQIRSSFVFCLAPVAITNRSEGVRLGLTWGIRRRYISMKLSKSGITKSTWNGKHSYCICWLAIGLTFGGSSTVYIYCTQKQYKEQHS